MDMTSINPAADIHIAKQNKKMNINNNVYATKTLAEFLKMFDPTTLTENREKDKKTKYDTLINDLYAPESQIQAEFYPVVITYDGIFGAHTTNLFERMKKLMDGGGVNMNTTYLKSLLQSTLFSRIYMIRHSNPK